jgi:hypothetical protein
MNIIHEPQDTEAVFKDILNAAAPKCAKGYVCDAGTAAADEVPEPKRPKGKGAQSANVIVLS